jgi:anti-anti-sigma regulatory factor
MSFRRARSPFFVDCDVAHVPCADLATVGALARAAVNSKRLGARLRVVNATPELEELLVLAGLDGVLLRRSRRQTEQREEALRVEERGVTDDPPV